MSYMKRLAEDLDLDMARAATCHDAPPILDPTPAIEAAVRAFAAAKARSWEAQPDARVDDERHALLRSALRAVEDAVPSGAWFLVDGRLWGWAKRSSRGGLAVVSEPVASRWPREVTP